MAEGLVQPANILASPLIDIALYEGLYTPWDKIGVVLESWIDGSYTRVKPEDVS
jgi:hypothetical protein